MWTKRFSLLALCNVSSVVVVILATTPNVIANTKAIDAKALSDRHRNVVEMSEVERSRLQRNVAAFEQLSETDKQKYRDLYRQIEEDKHALTLMHTYTAWLHTLTPGQREELRRATDASRKYALVRKLKEEQSLSLSVFSDQNQGGRNPHKLVRLLPEELQTLMKILAADLPDDVRKKLESNKAGDYLKILQHLVLHFPDSPQAWPPRELLDNLIATFKRQELREFINERKPFERDALLMLILFNIRAQALDDIYKRLPPEPELQRILESAEGDEKAKLDKLNPQEQYQELVRLYYDRRTVLDKKNEVFKHALEFLDGMNQLVVRLNIPLPWNSEFPFRLLRQGERGGPPRPNGPPLPHPGGPPPHARGGPFGGGRRNQNDTK